MSHPSIPFQVPAQILAKIHQLKALETQLGHLPNETFTLDALQDKIQEIFSPFQTAQHEQQTELLFGDICDELAALNLGPDEIAKIINGVIFYAGGPQYCNSIEVSEALGISP